MEVQQPYDTIFPERQVVYAGFWERFAAAFVDGVILNIVCLPITYLINGAWLGNTISSFFVTTLISWFYNALQESGIKQATVGKRLLDIKVTNGNGGRPSFGQATGRHFGKWISAIILLIGYFMMLWDNRKQTLHDKMADTLVVRSHPQA